MPNWLKLREDSEKPAKKGSVGWTMPGQLKLHEDSEKAARRGSTGCSTTGWPRLREDSEKAAKKGNIAWKMTDWLMLHEDGERQAWRERGGLKMTDNGTVNIIDLKCRMVPETEIDLAVRHLYGISTSQLLRRGRCTLNHHHSSQ